MEGSGRCDAPASSAIWPHHHRLAGAPPLPPSPRLHPVLLSSTSPRHGWIWDLGDLVALRTRDSSHRPPWHHFPDPLDKALETQANRSPVAPPRTRQSRFLRPGKQDTFQPWARCQIFEGSGHCHSGCSKPARGSRSRHCKRRRRQIERCADRPALTYIRASLAHNC